MSKPSYLPRFSHPSALREFNPADLITLVRPHADFLLNHGLPVPDNPGDLDIERLGVVLLQPLADTPPDLVDALSHIHEMSTAEGMETLTEEVRYVGASSIPFSEYKRKRGDRVGLNWRIPNVAGRRAVRHVLFDTNYWKSFIHARLAVPMGDPGCVSLFGRNPAPGSSNQHRLLAEHLTAEYRVKTEGRGRTVDEWKLRLSGADNHWLDCLVGTAVAASIQGAVLFGTDAKPRSKRPRVRLSELQRAKR